MFGLVRLFSQVGGLRAIEAENGAERIRTADLLSAIQALFQLSYGPFIKIDERGWFNDSFPRVKGICRALFLFSVPD